MSTIDSMEFWLSQLANRSSGVRRQYPYYLRKFAAYIGKSPNELIQMKQEALQHGGDRRNNMVLEGHVKQFMRYLETEATTARGDKGYRIGTRKLAYAAIRSFFDLNQYPLQMKRNDGPTGDAEGSRIPEKQEVLALVNTAKSRRYRAVILTLKDTGLRLSDVVQLTWKGMQAFDDDFYGWKVITQKRKVKALPFIGPEASTALAQLPHTDKRLFPISPVRLCHGISEVIQEAQLEGLTPHGLRKFFNVELQNARVPKEHRYAMMGKRTGVYDETRQTTLFKMYKQSYDHLRVFGVVSQEDEIKALKAEVAAYHAEREHVLSRLQRLEAALK